MKPLRHTFSQRLSIETLLVAGIGLITLALWMLPALAGSGSPYDSFICALWAIGLICLLTLNYQRVLRAETRERTVYLDGVNHLLYSQKVGTVPYRNGCHLAEIMGSCFARNASASHPEEPNPSEFHLTAIIRTTAFDCHISTPDPAFSFENLAIHEWAGEIESVKTGQTHSFESLSQLEDLLCPLMNVDAISLTGACAEAHTNACLCNEHILRAARVS